MKIIIVNDRGYEMYFKEDDMQKVLDAIKEIVLERDSSFIEVQKTDKEGLTQEQLKNCEEQLKFNV